MRSKFFAVLSLIVVASMVLTACATPTAAPTEQAAAPTAQTIIQTVVVEKQGESKTVVVTATPEPKKEVVFKSKDATTFTAMTFGDPETLFPALAYDTASGGVIFNTYDTLIFYKKESVKDLVPMLASELPTQANGGISADGLTYTFKVRKGVKFHSGEEMTVGDVAYSLQQGILAGGTSSPQWLFVEPILGSSASNDIADQITEEDMTKAGVKTDEGVVDNRENLAKIDAAKLEAVCTLVKDHIKADEAAGTVTVKLSQPWGPFLVTLAGSWGAIRQQKWSAANGAWDGDCKTWQKFYAPTSEEVGKVKVGSAENGTGPYKLDHWTPKEELVYVANDAYWMKDALWAGAPTGAPKIKKVVVKQVEEFSTRLAAFKAGDADVIAVGSAENWPQMESLVGETCDPVDPTKCTASKDIPNGAVRMMDNVKGASRTDAFFNFTVNTTGGNNFMGSGKLDGNGIPANFFQDVHVRKAFAYCFDMETYIADVQQGYGKQANNMMLFGEIGDSDQSPKYTYDVEKCTAEFKLSKWTEGPKDKDGNPTYKPDENGKISLWDTGFRLSAGFNTGNTSRQSVAQIFQAGLSAVNPKFVLEAVGLPWPTYLQTYRAGKLPFYVLGWQEDIPDPHNWTFTYAGAGGAFSSKQKMPKDMIAAFAPLIEKGVKESDPAKRAAIYAELNKLFFDNVPTILLSQGMGKHFEQRWVQGWYNNPIYPDYWYYSVSKK